MPENSDAKERLHSFVRYAMMSAWDPIGVRGIPGAQQEYDPYVSGVCQLLTASRSTEEIFNHLWWIETEHMGLEGDRQTTKTFAEYLHGGR